MLYISFRFLLFFLPRIVFVDKFYVLKHIEIEQFERTSLNVTKDTHRLISSRFKHSNLTSLVWFIMQSVYIISMLMSVCAVRIVSIGRSVIWLVLIEYLSSWCIYSMCVYSMYIYNLFNLPMLSIITSIYIYSF